MKKQLIALLIVPLIIVSACKKDENDDMMTTGPQAKDPNTAEKVAVDRFSSDAGTLFVRDGSNGLPGANMPVNFDQGPFITQGLAPDGTPVRYYNFDVMPEAPAPIFALFREGADMPVDGQLNIINVIPGDASYSDFWQVHKVTVPADYVANVVTSYQEIVNNGYMVTPTDMIVNCPVVPEGSTASLRYNDNESTDLHRGWYNGKVVFYFTFAETSLMVSNGKVPVSDILVSFNINPGEPGGGPPSGFMTEGGSMQTHNVVQTTPANPGYSPFWDVDIYDNNDFDMVMDWASASNANILATGAALVNCPVVWKQ